MSGPNPAIMIENFGTLAIIFQSLSVMFGVGLFMGGMFVLKKYGETRTFMSQHMTIAAPLMMLFAAVMMLLLPTMINTALFAFWGDYTPEHYDGSGGGWHEYVPVVLIFVRLIGVGSFMRGIFLLSRVGGQHGGQQGIIGKSLIHLFGGILLIHILGTWELLKRIMDMA